MKVAMSLLSRPTLAFGFELATCALMLIIQLAFTSLPTLVGW